jgi:hypothetical protein
MYKPQDFLIGVIDLFVIILPGALLIFAALRVAYGYPLMPLPAAVWSDLAAAAAFVGGAYLLGHLVSYVGSLSEDAFHRTAERQVLAQEENVRKTVAAALKRLGLPVEKQLNVRRQAATYLRLHDPAAAAHIERKDADRRFFRNVTVVLVFPVVAFLVRGNWVEALFWGALFAASLLRYFDQQKKFTRDVFEYFLLSTARGPQKQPV